jgi:hypothetical protein
MAEIAGKDVVTVTSMDAALAGKFTAATPTA